MKDQKDCKVCYKIICRQCKWIACEEDVLQIQAGTMTVCPECGWKPGDAVL